MKTKIPPWKKSAPSKSKRKKMTVDQKSAAKTRAKKAGRQYPNLVDNMWETTKSKPAKSR